MPGTLVQITPKGDISKYKVITKQPELKQLQELVGGYIERVKVRYEGKVRDAYLDEEGLYKKNMHHNFHAARMMSEAYKLDVMQPILGNIVIWVPNSILGDEEYVQADAGT